MIDEEDLDAFIEHWGVKGMHWGVRHDPQRTPPTFQQRLAIAEQQRKERRKKLIIAGGAAAIITGAFFATNILSHHGDTPLRNIHVPKSAMSAAEAAIHAEHDKQLYSLRRMFTEGKMDQEQFNNFSKKLADRYARKIMDLGG